MLVSILSVSVVPGQMSWDETALALAPLCGDLKPEDNFTETLPSDVGLQEVKFVLNTVLPLCHLLRSLARLGVGEFSTASPLGFESSLAHLH